MFRYLRKYEHGSIFEQKTWFLFYVKFKYD